MHGTTKHTCACGVLLNSAVLMEMPLRAPELLARAVSSSVLVGLSSPQHRCLTTAFAVLAPKHRHGKGSGSAAPGQ